MSPAPAVAIGVEAVRRRGRSWRVSYRIRSRGGALTIVEAWHPHGRFRSSRRPRQVAVPAHGSASLEMPARVEAESGDVVENCFLILAVRRGRERWRILGRLTLRMDTASVPRLTVERIDAHADAA